MKITRIRIGLRPDANLRPMASLYGAPGDEAPPTPPAGEDGYWAEVIEAEGKFFYRVHGTTIEITEYEFHQVAKNPFLYYFSTALKLHNRIKHQSETDPVSAVSAGSSPDAATAETEAQPEAVKHSYGSQMAPRQFLRAVGAHWWGSDLDADRATDGEIAQFWPQVVASPITFDVREGGALWIGGMALPKCRAEWLALSISDHPTLENILDLAEQYSGVEYVLAQAYLELTNSDNGDPELVDPKLVRHWLRSSGESVTNAGDRLRTWLADHELGEDDYAEAQRMGTDPQSAALLFWRDGRLDRRMFGVVIIDGQTPGNDYYAAELRVSIDEANARARSYGVPIRFVAAGSLNEE